jgi:hypothetical protein
MNEKLAKELEKFLEWKRDKELYPPRWTPEDYAEHLVNMDARIKLQRLYDVFNEQDPGFLTEHTNPHVDMIEEILND